MNLWQMLGPVASAVTGLWMRWGPWCTSGSTWRRRWRCRGIRDPSPMLVLCDSVLCRTATWFSSWTRWWPASSKVGTMLTSSVCQRDICLNLRQHSLLVHQEDIVPIKQVWKYIYPDLVAREVSLEHQTQDVTDLFAELQLEWLEDSKELCCMVSMKMFRSSVYIGGRYCK